MNTCPEGGAGRGAREARRSGAAVHRRAQSGPAGDGQAGGLGERRMERRCAGVIDAAGLARGAMGEDCLAGFGRFDARDDAQRTATHATVFDVDVEDSLKPLHPAHGRGTRRLRLAGALMDRVGDDAAAVLEVRGKHAVVSDEMGTGTWDRASSARASGTSAAARRTMPNRQDCRFAQPEAAPKGCSTRMCSGTGVRGSPGHGLGSGCPRDVAFRSKNSIGSAAMDLSGLNHAAYRLPVYASQPGSPPDRTTLGSGWWPALIRSGLSPVWSHRGFPACSSPLHDLPSSPSFAWRKCAYPSRVVAGRFGRVAIWRPRCRGRVDDDFGNAIGVLSGTAGGVALSLLSLRVRARAYTSRPSSALRLPRT